METASQLPEEPDEIDLGPATDHEIREAGGRGLQITGLKPLGGSNSSSRFSGLFESSDSSDEGDEDFDEDEAGRDTTVGRAEGDYEDESSSSGRRSWAGRRPSTTEAKERRPLDDGDEDEDEASELGTAMESKLHLGEGPFADPAEMEEEEDSDEDELVEIRPRRIG